MNDPHNLQRFVDAQDGVFDIALSEILAGSKRTHWMWFIFPQLRGLGRTPTAHCFGISSMDEGKAYLQHAILGPRLRQAVEAMLRWAGQRSPEAILGTIDSVKLRSCLTLFDCVEPDGTFGRALDCFFGSVWDQQTLALLNRSA